MTTWAQALAWRLGRQYLQPAGDVTVRQIVERLVAVPAWSGDPERAIGIRRMQHEERDVSRALADQELIRTYAFGGATHLMTPEVAGVHLALRGASRQWERRSWQEFYHLEPGDWPALREFVRGALTAGPLSQDDLAREVVADRRFAHLRDALLDKSQTILKPFAWQGDLSFGPTRDGASTFRSLDGAPGWVGIPEVDEAGPRAIHAYLSAYGPAVPERVHYWLTEGLSAGKKRVDGWLASMSDRLTIIDLEGDRALCLTEFVDDVNATAPASDELRLAGHDPWVRGPGTADQRVVPSELRPLATRGANLLLRGGRVAGTW